jgi:hypothetical protein
LVKDGLVVRNIIDAVYEFLLYTKEKDLSNKKMRIGIVSLVAPRDSVDGDYMKSLESYFVTKFITLNVLIQQKQKKQILPLWDGMGTRQFTKTMYIVPQGV